MSQSPLESHSWHTAGYRVEAHDVLTELYSLGCAGKGALELLVMAADQTQYFPPPYFLLSSFFQSRMTCFVKPVLPWPTLSHREESKKLLEHWTLKEALEDPLTSQSLLDLWGHT